MFRIGNTNIGEEYPTYIIAELSCNHHGKLENALKLVHAAKEAGANAVKLQTYTGDTITFKSDKEWFKLKNTNWDDRSTLWDLFNEAHTPWEWHKDIQNEAHKLGLDFFSSPFDHTAVDFLEDLNVPAYKIASMEITDVPLLKKVASTGKPVIVSTGMASLSEIDEAVKTLKDNGAECVALLKCTSAYPAKPEDANLRTIKHLNKTFNCVSGLSDHTFGIAVPVTSIGLGAHIIEKHFILDRSEGGPDSAFSLEPVEFKQMVENVRVAEKALGKVHFGGVKNEVRLFRRSLFVVKDIQPGEELIPEVNYRSIRPGVGMNTRHYDDVKNKKAKVFIEAGTPLSWDLLC